MNGINRDFILVLSAVVGFLVLIITLLVCDVVLNKDEYYNTLVSKQGYHINKIHESATENEYSCFDKSKKRYYSEPSEHLQVVLFYIPLKENYEDNLIDCYTDYITLERNTAVGMKEGNLVYVLYYKDKDEVEKYLLLLDKYINPTIQLTNNRVKNVTHTFTTKEDVIKYISTFK